MLHGAIISKCGGAMFGRFRKKTRRDMTANDSRPVKMIEVDKGIYRIVYADLY